MEFWLLPPEINSARIYIGAASSPLMTAATSWDAIASELTATALSWRSITADVCAIWTGPSSVAMSTASAVFASWLTSTAAQAERTANQARAAAAAFETARAASVPPPVIAANRAQLHVLVATNLLGQNTAAIMALEAAYAEMWAQDVAAMAAYQAASAAATAGLPQFNAAPPVTTPGQTAGTSSPGAWSYLLGGQTVPQLFWALVQSNVSSGPWQEVTDLLALFTVFWGISSATGSDSPLGGALTKISNHIDLPAPTAEAAAPPKITVSTGGAANQLGRLSAPSWAQPPASPARGAARPLPPNETEVPLPLPAPIPVGARGGTPPKQQRPQPEYGAVVRFVPRPPSGG